MTVKLPTNAPETAPERPVENESVQNKFDRFHPEMPRIPGVDRRAQGTEDVSVGFDRRRILQIGGAAAAVFLIALIVFWRPRSKPSGPAGSTNSGANLTEQAAPAALPPSPIAPLQEGPIVAATLEELSKPWSVKKFVFLKSLTQERTDAMVIRIPGGGLWAFSLQGPFERCELEYVTDLRMLRSQYGYNAGHPMVVSPCDRTVYDPLKVGPIGSDTWARGEIVQGNALRPPLAIDVKVSGHSIIADSME